MWLVANIFERYTTSVAKTFLKIAALEAEANRKALDNLRRRRLEKAGLVPGTAAAAEPAAPIVDVPAEDPQPAQTREESSVVPALPVVEAKAPEAELRHLPDVERTFREVPMGVRGDVVSHWVDALYAADPGAVVALMEQLRKDKKVRVPELQWIAVNVLDEEPAVRKKADHLMVLRDHLVVSAVRTRLGNGQSHPLHA